MWTMAGRLRPVELRRAEHSTTGTAVAIEDADEWAAGSFGCSCAVRSNPCGPDRRGISAKGPLMYFTFQSFLRRGGQMSCAGGAGSRHGPH